MLDVFSKPRRSVPFAFAKCTEQKTKETDKRNDDGDAGSKRHLIGK